MPRRGVPNPWCPLGSRQDEEGEMVYTWEDGMDEAYRASNLKAFKKLLDTPRCARMRGQAGDVGGEAERWGAA